MGTNWIYYGIFFDDDTKEKICNHAEKLCNKHGLKFNKNWKIYCDHMTLVYNNGHLDEQALANFYEPMLGQKQMLRCIGVDSSDKSVALWIDFETNNEHSHVTVLVGPTGKPVDSNYITNWVKDDGKNLEITGIYKKVTK